MDKDRMEGAKDKVAGSVKETIGKVTGNERTEAEGKVQKNAGKVRGKVGEAKDSVRDTFRK